MGGFSDPQDSHCGWMPGDVGHQHPEGQGWPAGHTRQMLSSKQQGLGGTLKHTD